MPVTEFYVKLVVAFPRDPKVRALVRLGPDAGLARDLYVQMLLHCKENLTDGFVPAEEVGVLAYPLPVDHANQLAKHLASVGLTKEASKNGADGWEVLAYVKRNGTKADVEALSAKRAEAGKAGGSVSRKPRKPAGSKPGQATGKQIGKQTGSISKPETDTSLSPPPPSDMHAKLAAAVPGTTERETKDVLALLASRPGVRSASAVLRSEIDSGTADALVAEVRRVAVTDISAGSSRKRLPHCEDRECSPQTRRREDPETGQDLGFCPKCSGISEGKF